MAPIAADPMRPTAMPPAMQDIPTASAAAKYFQMEAGGLSSADSCEYASGANAAVHKTNSAKTINVFRFIKNSFVI
jgi:hypothetical protein